MVYRFFCGIKKLLFDGFIIFLLILPVGGGKCETGVLDYLGSPYKEEAELLIKYGLLQPEADGKYHLEKHLTRGEAAELLCRMLEIPPVGKDAKVTFKDITSEHPNFGYIAQSKLLGLINTYEENFCPALPFQREKLWRALVKYLAPEKIVTLDEAILILKTYKDGISGVHPDPEFRRTVATALKLGWVKTKDGHIYPKEIATKGDLVYAVAWARFPILTVAALNDFHGALSPKKYRWLSEDREVGGAAYLASYFKKIKGDKPQYTLIVDNGDAISPSPYANFSKGESVIAAYNAIGIESMAIANHEFDYGIERLKELIKLAKFPILSANVFYKNTGKPVDWLAPYTIIEKGHLKVGVIGFAPENTPLITLPKNVEGFSFKNITEVAKDIVPILKKEGAEIVIILSTSAAYLEEGEIKGPAAEVAKVPQVDAVIAGDNHTRIAGYVKEVPVVEAYHSGIGIGIIKLVYDKVKKKIIERHVDVIFTFNDEIEPDRETEKTLRKYIEATNAILSEKIGVTKVYWKRESDRESNAGNFVADVIREVGKAQIGFTNAGGLREDIPPGDITVRSIYELFPFDNVIVTMELTGAQVKEILEGPVGKMQVSGVTFKYDVTKPAGSRVIDMKLSSGKKIELNKWYKVATNSFLAMGGDGYETFKRGKNIKYTDILIRDALIEYIKEQSKANKTIDPKIESRIQIIKESSYIPIAPLVAERILIRSKIATVF